MNRQASQNAPQFSPVLPRNSARDSLKPEWTISVDTSSGQSNNKVEVNRDALATQSDGLRSDFRVTKMPNRHINSMRHQLPSLSSAQALDAEAGMR